MTPILEIIFLDSILEPIPVDQLYCIQTKNMYFMMI